MRFKMYINKFNFAITNYIFDHRQYPKNIHKGILSKISWNEDTVSSQLNQDRIVQPQTPIRLNDDFLNKNREEVYAYTNSYLSKTYNIRALINFLNASKLIGEREEKEVNEFNEKKAIAYKCIAIHLMNKQNDLPTFRRIIQLVGLVTAKFFRKLDLKPMLSAIVKHDNDYHFFNQCITEAKKFYFHSPRGPCKAPIIIAKAEAKKGNRIAAIETLNQICKKKVSINKFPEIYSNIAKLQAEGGEFQAAFLSAKMISENTIKVDALIAIANEQNKKGESFTETVDEALSIAESIQNERDKALALIAIAEIQSKDDVQNTLDKALNAAEKIPYEKDEMFSKIARVQARAGLFEEALRTVNMISKANYKFSLSNYKFEAIISIAKAQDKKENHSGALETLTKILNSEDWEGCPQNKKVYILGLLAKIKMEMDDSDSVAKIINDARMIADTIEEDKEKALVYNTLAKAQVKMGDHRGATQTINHALVITDRITYGLDNVKVLVKIAKVQIKAKNHVDAITTLALALKKIDKAEIDWCKAELLIDIAKVQKKAKRRDIAIETLHMAYEAKVKQNDGKRKIDKVFANIALSLV